MNYSRKRVVRRSLLGLAAAVLFCVLFLYFVLPNLVASQIERLIAHSLQRPATVGAVELHPLRLAATVRTVQVKEAKEDAAFAGFDALHVNLSAQSLWRFAPIVQEARLVKPYLKLIRTEAHRYNIDDILTHLSNQPPSAQAARFALNNLQVEDGRIEFDDRPARTTHTVDQLTLGVPFLSSLPSDVQVFVEPLISARVNGTPLLLKGRARPFSETRDAELDLNLDDLDVTRYLGYLPFKPQVRLHSGRLHAQLTARFQQPKGQASALLLGGTIALKSLQLNERDGTPALKLGELALELRDMNPLSQRVDLTRLALNGLQANLRRTDDGRFSFEDWLPAAPATPAAPAAPAAQAAAARQALPASAPTITLGELVLYGATVRYLDADATRPLQAGVDKLTVNARKIALDLQKRSLTVGDITSNQANFLLRHDKPDPKNVAAIKAAPEVPKSTANARDTESAAHPPYAVSIHKLALENWSARLEDHGQPQPMVTLVTPIRASLHNLSTLAGTTGKVALKAQINKTGEVALDGQLALAPLQTALALQLKSVDLLPLQPYITDKINLRLTRAGLSGAGQLQLHQVADGTFKGGFKGDVALVDVAASDKLSNNDFLRWKSLQLNSLDVQFAPFALTLGHALLNDFFSRIIIDPSGRLNLQDILRTPAQAQTSLTDAGKRSAAASNAVAPAPQAGKAGAKAAPFTIRKLTLQGGRVRFTDNFIKPNYSALLANLSGAVTDISPSSATAAHLALRGEVNNAPLSVSGRLHPLQDNLSLDIQASVRGMELAPLSAYSSRYMGHGIEKGKLSFEVRYRVADRTLSAENRLKLDQLTFGKKANHSDSAPAPAFNLPLQFAVALLQDSNGVIDLDLPIGGSLDDPQFSVGSIIMKALGNALAKAIAQPFVLLGKLFGGGAELSSLELDPGRSTIPAAAETKLKSLAKALADRPALRLEISGSADASADLPGLKRAAIERKVRALKSRQLAAAGKPTEPTSITVEPAEYPALLAQVYHAEAGPKPRNFLGLPKNLTVSKMEKLMMDNLMLDEDDLLRLANQRAQAVKNWLIKNGPVPEERIFLVTPTLHQPSATEGAPRSAGHRVDFSLM